RRTVSRPRVRPSPARAGALPPPPDLPPVLHLPCGIPSRAGPEKRVQGQDTAGTSGGRVAAGEECAGGCRLAAALRGGGSPS
ncbi:unnamed protein product, partial [Urochloa humidicola]